MNYSIGFVCIFVFAGQAFTQNESEDQKRKALAEASRRTDEVIATKDYQEKIPFAKFLALFSKQLSSKSKFVVRLDREAFGKDADRFLNEEIVLPPVPARMSAHLALRLAVAQVDGGKYQIEFSAFPGELVITTRDRSFFTLTHEIGDILPHVRHLRDKVKQYSGGVFGNDLPGRPALDSDADPARPAEWIVRNLMANDDRAGWHGRTPASTMRVVNGTRLVVHTVPSVHREIEQFLSVLRRLMDLAVVMNARVYELDRAEYAAHFAAAFADAKDKSARKLVATVSEAQWKRLQSLKPILRDTAEKLTPQTRAKFLSMQNAYQYLAKPGDEVPTTAFEGMSFTVRPTMSPDRRCLRLEFSHDVNQLVKITKGTMVDLKTGKDAPIELPNIRKSSAKGTIEIHDGQPIMLAVDYRPKDKVWLVLAEPRIYMEEEEEMIRKSAIKRMPMADEPPAPPEVPMEPQQEPVPKPPVQLPDTEDVRQILRAVVESVLTDRHLKSTRDFYGTPKAGKFVLNMSQIRWPKNVDPKVGGYTQVEQPGKCQFNFQNRLMGIRLDQFEWDGKKAVKEFTIEVVISNVGGQTNGAVIGGCFASYTAKREGKRWVVQLDEILDP